MFIFSNQPLDDNPLFLSPIIGAFFLPQNANNNYYFRESSFILLYTPETSKFCK